jgi:hypothetical protein
MGLFGGGDSSSVQRQESWTADDQSIGGGVDGGARLSNVRGNVRLEQTTITNGLDGATVSEILGGVSDVAGQIFEQQARQADTVGDIARSATATQTETGKTINQLALPIIALVAVALLIPAFTKGK